jgi:hypothetical protein
LQPQPGWAVTTMRKPLIIGAVVVAAWLLPACGSSQPGWCAPALVGSVDAPGEPNVVVVGNSTLYTMIFDSKAKDLPLLYPALARKVNAGYRVLNADCGAHLKLQPTSWPGAAH